MKRAIHAAWLSLLLCAGAHGQALQVHGLLDLRAVAAPDDTSWQDGGQGKTRFGQGDDGVTGSAVLSATWQATPALLASAEVQLQPDMRTEFDVLHAYLRYRPVSTNAWRWSVRAGAFYPPISLENEGIGWTSLWTLTPSAINSWIGEELRTIGAEATLEHRGGRGTVSLAAALFGANDPAGELLAARGWAMGDVTSGLRAEVREPDAYARQNGVSAPILYQPFEEFDDRLGGYATLSWRTPQGDQARLMYYDNRADPAAFEAYGDRSIYGWRTRFWSVGIEHHLDQLMLMAQAMHGRTDIEPAPQFLLTTDFNAGYLMAAWEGERFTPVLRVDLFQTRQGPDALLSLPLSEHGHALTAALNWRPRPGMRVTGEWLWIDSVRNQRRLDQKDARSAQQQLQLSLRYLF